MNREEYEYYKSKRKRVTCIKPVGEELYFNEGRKRRQHKPKKDCAEKDCANNVYISCKQGEVGAQGPQGVGGVGFRGYQGPQGPRGFQGIDGIGIIGNQGPQGLQGLQGSFGLQGPQGFQGPEGGVGPQGITGPQGFQGLDRSNVVGLQGPQGYQGDSGEVGPTGPMDLADAAQASTALSEFPLQPVSGTPISWTTNRTSYISSWPNPETWQSPSGGTRHYCIYAQFGLVAPSSSADVDFNMTLVGTGAIQASSQFFPSSVSIPMNLLWAGPLTSNSQIQFNFTYNSTSLNILYGRVCIQEIKDQSAPI